VIVDASALVAVIRHEAGYERVRNAIADTVEPVRIAAPGYLETAIVIDSKRDPKASRTLDNLIEAFEIEIVPFTAEHARLAREAYRDYGKGSGHPAKLNFGDSIAYALASSAREPLLFIGNDFSHTDIEPALT
jgi:ribonuclease VapC